MRFELSPLGAHCGSLKSVRRRRRTLRLPRRKVRAASYPACNTHHIMARAASVRTLGLLIAVWYGASIVAIVSAKTIYTIAACPASLCVVQLLAAAVGTRATMTQLQPLAQAEYLIVAAISSSYTFGFLLTNAAIASAAPSFVETIKAGEPLSTVALAALFLHERERPLTVAWMVPIVVGVAMASGADGSARHGLSAVGLLLALASNMAFSGRAVLTKALRRAHPEVAAARSDACLFHHVSRLGLMVALPAALLLDAHSLLSVLVPPLYGLLWPLHRLPVSNDSMGIAGMGDSGGGAAADGIRNGGSVTSADGGSLVSHALGEGVQAGAPTAPSALWLLALLATNAASHALYNGISFAVLSRVSVGTHAVLNIVRRVALIGVSAATFGTDVHWTGVSLCAVGCAGFARSKRAGASPEAGQPSLLPVVSPSALMETLGVVNGKTRRV